MIYITGDIHADFSRFSTDSFPEQKTLTREDFVIVCGDFGIWHDTPTERWWLKWLSEKSFTVLFVDGNHENFDRLNSEFEVVDFHGGKAHKICDNVYHLMRGYIFELCGKKIFAFGGASSHDIKDGILEPDDFKTKSDCMNEFRKRYEQGQMVRINHISWWKDELPTQEELNFGLKTLSENDNSVDFIISHCCPQSVVSVFSNGMYKSDRLTQYFNKIADIVSFDKWYFGHYHDNTSIMNKYVLLYEQIVRVV